MLRVEFAVAKPSPRLRYTLAAIIIAHPRQRCAQIGTIGSSDSTPVSALASGIQNTLLGGVRVVLVLPVAGPLEENW